MRGLHCDRGQGEERKSGIYKRPKPPMVGFWNLTFGSNLEQSGGGVMFREKEKREKRQTLDSLMKSKKDLSEAMVDGVQPV